MDLNKYISKAASEQDMTKIQVRDAQSTYTPPPPGVAMLRLVGYIECGKHKDSYQGQETIKNKVKIVFELHGKNYPTRDVGGHKVPYRLTISENLSLHEKSNFRKLFEMMRAGDTDIKHFSQMLGKPFIGKVFNEKSKTDQTKVYAKLRDASGYYIGPAIQEDPVSGEVRRINVPEALSPLRLFLWDFADKEMWDNIYIDGQYGNVFQDYIKQAINFKGSRTDKLLNGTLDSIDQLDNLADQLIEKKRTGFSQHLHDNGFDDMFPEDE